MRNLKEYPGKDPIFIDANIFLYHAFDGLPGASAFLERVESTGIKAFTSALVLEEVLFKLLLQAVSADLGSASLPEIKKALENPTCRKKAVIPVKQYAGYLDVLKDCGMGVLDLTDADIRESLMVTEDTGLITADSAHLAVMKKRGISHIATADRDFLRARGITVWTP
jgi:predicted nucleic acid-binding protein